MDNPASTSKNYKRPALKLAFLALLIVGTVIIVAQQRNTPYQHNEGFVFGTVYHVTYQYDRDLQREIETKLKLVDTTFSTFNPRSLVSQFNRSGKVSPNKMFWEVYGLACDVNKESDGAFDITVAPLVNAWGFGFKNQQLPTNGQVKELRTHLGMRKVRKDARGLTLYRTDPKTMLDFSAIAKGYGADVVADYLRQQGIKNFMVEIGGEVVTSGISQSRVPWKIGVTKPIDNPTVESQELQTVLNITDKAMATSGNYRNFYYKGGRKYAHTIDPKTGYPVQHSLLSATVLADNCATADAYATAFMVMGIQHAKGVLERHPKLMAYFIYSDAQGKNRVWYSPSLQDKLPQ